MYPRCKIKILITIVSLSFSQLNGHNTIFSECNDNGIKALIHIMKPKKKDYQYYVVDFMRCNEKVKLDSFFTNNYMYFNFQASRDIYLIDATNDTLRPQSYIYEGNIEGIRPFYRIVVGYEKKMMKGKNYRFMTINMPTLKFNIQIEK